MMPTDDRVSFEIRAGQCTRVTLYAGKRARAQWHAKATFAGHEVNTLGLQLQLQGTRYPFYAYSYGEEGACAERLPPRAYRVRMLDLPDLNFELAPGEVRRDSFEIPARQVLISADAALCNLLDQSESGVSLTLSAQPTWALLQHHGISPLPEQDCLFKFAQTLRVLDDEAEANHRWHYNIPPGVYEWRLSSGTRNIVGLLDLRGRGDTAVELSLRNLPGLAVLEVPCAGYPEGELPDVDFPALLPDFGNTALSEEVQEIYSCISRVYLDEARNTWVVIAPPGRALLRIMEQEFTYYRQVTLPGTLTLSPMACATLRIENDDSRHSLVGAATCNGMIVAVDCMNSNYASVTYLPAGNWLFHLRGECLNAEGESTRVFAQTWIYLAPGEQEMPASRLPWRACGQATLRLPSEPLLLSAVSNGQLTAQALDLADLGVTLKLGSDEPEYKGTTVQLCFKGLPEGRYRLQIPVRNGKKDVEFYVDAGQSIEIRPETKR